MNNCKPRINTAIISSIKLQHLSCKIREEIELVSVCLIILNTG